MRMRQLALLLCLVQLAAPAQPLTAQTAERIVAIGDIHGAFDEFKRILKAAGLADDTGRWTGGKTALLQTGDYTDRGTGTRAVLDLLMALEPQAKKAGGRAFAVLGNHEVMNLIGDTRDVTPEIFATFADAKSAARQKQAWEQYAKLGPAKAAKGEPVPAVYQQTAEAWLAAHPPGYVEYRDALGPRGKYGAWLRNKPIVTEYGGSIFMHAGIAPDRAPAKIEELNVKVRDEIARLDRFVKRLVDAKLALPSFTLQEILAVAVNEITVANAADCRGERERRAGGRLEAESAAAERSARRPDDRSVGRDAVPKGRCGTAACRRCRTTRPAGRLPRCCSATARSGSSPGTRRSRTAVSTSATAAARC